MPQLNKTKAEAVAAAEAQSFEPLPEGRYVLKLKEVTSKEGAKGPYWNWEYEVAEGDFSGRRLWDITSLSEASEWRLKLTFDAFGVPADTNTDELIGKVVAAWVGQEVQSQGQNAGKIRNRIEEILPASPVERGDEEEPF